MPSGDAGTESLSYRYLRVALVGLLLALATAVFYQSSQQGSFLASVSAYYYTPAQAVFVGALIGLGACMIALQGVTAAEDMLLNLGGMFAMIVAIIPTGRGSDFESALRACQQGAGTLIQRAAPLKLDCPSAVALDDAAKGNVENNLVALLAVGGLGIALAAVILLVTGKLTSSNPDRGWVLAGLAASVLVWLAALIGLAVSVSWLTRDGHGHYIAAIGLLVTIFLVAVANARRREEQPSAGGLLTSPRSYVYSVTAILMLAGAAVLIVLWLTGVISLFWVEIGVAFLFIVFWTVQTIELMVRGTSLAKA